MIGYIRGKAKFMFEDSCIIDTGGVGYKVYVDSNTLGTLRQNNEVELFIYTSVREDSITLYGFRSQMDYDLFAQLINVSGIGAKTALNALSKISSKELAQAIYQKNVNALTKLPGIGKKSAERLILELKDKISADKFNEDEEGGWAPDVENLNAINEATGALKSLGYTAGEIESAFKGANKSMKTGELIKLALRELTRF